MCTEAIQIIFYKSGLRYLKGIKIYNIPPMYERFINFNAYLMLREIKTYFQYFINLTTSKEMHSNYNI